MPTYEYRCNECDHKFEEFQSITAAPVKICPVCKGSVQRLIGGGNGLIFKGSGFYITDYKHSKQSASGPAKKAESKDSDSKAEKKESKSSQKSTDSEK
ncbi:MAG: FmdB family zinc ribbon protein [bacterium]